MRKFLIFTALLLTVCLVSLTAATAFLIPISDDVVVSQTVLYGDPSAAEGLNVDFRCQYKSTLHWDIHCDPQTGESATDFIFSRDDPFYVPYEFPSRGVELYSLLDYRFHDFNLYDDFLPPEDSGIGRLLKTLNAVPIPETGEDAMCVIDLSDYFEYQPFEGWLDLPDFSHSPTWYSHSQYLEIGGEEKQLAKLFGDYFKIPVMENALVEVYVYPTSSSQLRDFYTGSYPQDSNFFIPETYGFTAGNSCYFTFGNRTLSGQTVDTSLIPGGWGIYRLDYGKDTSGNLTIGSLSTVYPLDTAENLMDMVLSDDEKTILLFTQLDQKCFLTVIDLATMETLQKVELLEAEYPTIRTRDSYIVAATGAELSVFNLKEDHTYELSFRVDISSDQNDLDLYSQYDMAFDGERLAVANILMRDVEEESYTHSYTTCGFTLSVYDSTGLVYYGEYGTSLEPAAFPGDIYGKQNYPNYNEPLVLTWE